MSSGAIAIVTSTLATVVIVIATMNAVNITHQHTPEIHSVRIGAEQGPRSAATAAPRAQQHASATA